MALYILKHQCWISIDLKIHIKNMFFFSEVKCTPGVKVMATD